MDGPLAQLDGLVQAAREAEAHREQASSYRRCAAVEAHPVRRQNLAETAAYHEEQAQALAPQLSRLRRAVIALEAALADEEGEAAG